MISDICNLRKVSTLSLKLDDQKEISEYEITDVVVKIKKGL